MSWQTPLFLGKKLWWCFLLLRLKLSCNVWRITPERPPFYHQTLHESWHLPFFYAGDALWICVGLARAVYMHHEWQYIWWFPCQKFCVCTVYVWFWPALLLCLKLSSYDWRLHPEQHPIGLTFSSLDNCLKVTHINIYWYLSCLEMFGWSFSCMCTFCRGGHLRHQMGVFLKCESSMVAKTGNNQAQFPEVADSTWA